MIDEKWIQDERLNDEVRLFIVMLEEGGEEGLFAHGVNVYQFTPKAKLVYEQLRQLLGDDRVSDEDKCRTANAMFSIGGGEA